MRHSHFETLRPICPRCRANDASEHDLKLAFVDREDGDVVIEGALQCVECELEFPIVDAIPVLVPNPRDYLAESITHVHARDDLGGRVEAMLGEACGPGSAFDTTRCHLNSYAWDHYAEFDPQEAPVDPPPGSVVRLLGRGLDARDAWQPIALDVGCSVGRTTFELARRTGGLALGFDKNFAMLRLAARVARTGEVRYPRRAHGMLFEQRAFDFEFERREDVDFWAADAAALPLRAGTIATASALNVLDAAFSPLDVLRELARVLAVGGGAVLAAPWDWSAAVTTPEAWIGGHSPRGFGDGDSAAVLRALLTPGAHPASVDGLMLEYEVERAAWRVRVHDRSTVEYAAQLVVASRA